MPSPIAEETATQAKIPLTAGGGVGVWGCGGWAGTKPHRDEHEAAMKKVFDMHLLFADRWGGGMGVGKVTHPQVFFLWGLPAILYLLTVTVIAR